MKPRPTTIDEYLAGLGAEQRLALQSLRETIHAVAPKAEECISYSVPAFRLKRLLVGFGATPKHCALHLLSGTTVEAHRELLKDFETSKGMVRFQPDKPLPVSLVRKLVKARLAENKALDAAQER